MEMLGLTAKPAKEKKKTGGKSKWETCVMNLLFYVNLCFYFFYIRNAILMMISFVDGSESRERWIISREIYLMGK